MARTALLYVLPATLVASCWLRLERPVDGVWRALLLAALALVPALVHTLKWRVVALLAVAPVAAWVALGAVRPGRLGSRFGNGVLEFYDVVLPFNPHRQPRMQDALLTGVFLFCLALGLAIAARRPVLAGFVVIAGGGWPSTLVTGGATLVRGAAILGALLLLWAGLRETRAAAGAGTLIAGGTIVACALAASTSPAIAKGEFLHWESWDLHSETHPAVGVSYVWDSDYSGLSWPKKRTVVLRIKAPPTAVYWRAAVLDAFRYGRWLEDVSLAFPRYHNGRADLSANRLLPRRGHRPSNWVKQEVTVEALRDAHLVGAPTPVAYEPGEVSGVSYAQGGVALVRQGVDQGQHYSVWSYEPRPTPDRLARVKAMYPPPIAQGWHHLGIGLGALAPPFGTPRRDEWVESVIGDWRVPGAYRALYHKARAVVGRAETQYGAVVALESWFRDSGRFIYDQHPPGTPGLPPLVGFVIQTHRGYCQHFAGAMALMLRYLGIPARVAVGFTSGSYDKSSREWVVTDHDAHAWVEVWFRGYGWLPFDPTPGRGSLGASYSASSRGFDASAAAAVVAGAGAGIRSLLENRARAQLRGFTGERPFARPGGPSAPGATTGGRAVGGQSLLRFLALVIAALIAAIVVCKLLRRRVRYLTRDPRRLAAACRRELIELLTDQRIELPSSVTLRELGRTLSDELAVSGDELVSAACTARFGTPAAAAAAAPLVRTEMRGVRRRLRSRLGKADRALGAISLRSLRTV